MVANRKRQHTSPEKKQMSNKKKIEKMKKIGIMMLGLMMTVAVGAKGTKGSNDVLQNTKQQVVENVQKAPRGTVWGVTEVASDHVTITSPLGKHRIECKDGTYSFMGLTARVTSAKNGVYKVKTNIGTFSVNTRKLTVTKE